MVHAMQMTKLIAVLALLAASAAAQIVSVSAVVTDPNGIPYSGGSVLASLSAAEQLNGTTYQPPPVTGLSDVGKFTMQLADNNILQPSGSTYSFVVCASASGRVPPFSRTPTCFTVSGVTITGQFVDLTGPLSNAATKIGVSGTTPGSLCGDSSHALGWNGTAYFCQGITGSAAAGGTNGQIQYNNSTALGGFTMSGDATLVTSTGVITVAALHLSPTPSQCGTNNFATGNTAGGGSNCAQPTFANLTATPTTLAGYGITNGANTALSNLSAVAINTALLPGSTGTINLGSSSFSFAQGWLKPTTLSSADALNIDCTGTSTNTGNILNLVGAPTAPASELTIDCVSGLATFGGSGTFAGSLTVTSAIKSTNGPISAGSTTVTNPMLSGVTGAWGCAEASTAGTPTSGGDYLRCDSGTHTIRMNLNGEGSEGYAPEVTSTTTTTTQALFASATANHYAPRAIASGDLPATIAANTTGQAANLTGGGTNQIVYQSAANTTAFLAANASTIQCLTQTSSGTPAWASCSSGGGSGTVNSGTATHLGYYATTGTAISDAGSDLTFNGTHTYSAASTLIFDISAATGSAAFKVPSTTTNTASAAGVIDYDTTNSNYHANSGADSIIGVVPTASVPTTGDVIDASVSSSKFLLHDSGVATANVVTAAANYTSGDLVQAAASNKTTSDSGVVAANVVTAASAAAAANQPCVSSGASKTCTYIDFPDTKTYPAANCNNTTAGAGWSIGSGGTVTCRAGTNNKGGYAAITDTSTTFAQFIAEVPADWDSGSNPLVRFGVASTDNTNGHTIIPAIQVSCAKGDGTTTDDVTFNAAHSAGTITLNTTANQFWSNSTLTMNSTDVTGCVAGSMMIVSVQRATDTATNADFYYVQITWLRRLQLQAN